MKDLAMPYPVLERIRELVFQPCGFSMSIIIAEPESREYFAYDFQLGERKVKFRIAKITAKKTGQFVTIWKRNKNGITAPFDISDDFDFYMIVTLKDDHFGLFTFTKAILQEKGILSNQDKCGKRGIRIYPIWDLTTNKQAQKTQTWQASYFINLSIDEKPDLERAESLLNGTF
ncbi:MAG: MepB family protein [Sphingobacteriaceae bacterium]